MNKKSTVVSKLKAGIASHPELLLCIVFGSIADEQENYYSDLDIAVAAEKPLDSIKKQALIEEFASIFERPVDLVDLQTASGTLLHQILTKGTLVHCSDHLLYAEIMKRMLFNQSDMMPYHHRILKERRGRWING